MKNFSLVLLMTLIQITTTNRIKSEYSDPIYLRLDFLNNVLGNTVDYRLDFPIGLLDHIF